LYLYFWLKRPSSRRSGALPRREGGKNRRCRRMKLQNDFSNERTRRKWKLGIISGRNLHCHRPVAAGILPAVAGGIPKNGSKTAA
jgi:hypothetical protein